MLTLTVCGPLAPTSDYPDPGFAVNVNGESYDVILPTDVLVALFKTVSRERFGFRRAAAWCGFSAVCRLVGDPLTFIREAGDEPIYADYEVSLNVAPASAFDARTGHLASGLVLLPGSVRRLLNLAAHKVLPRELSSYVLGVERALLKSGGVRVLIALPYSDRTSFDAAQSLTRQLSMSGGWAATLRRCVTEASIA